MRILRLLIPAIILAMIASPFAYAETQYSGRAGVEYQVYDYRGSRSQSLAPKLLRQLFEHNVSFAANGSLGPEKYGHWLFGVSATGYYDRASGDLGSTSNYYAPDLQNLRGDLNLLPKTRIPFQLSYAREHSYNLEYETKNRYVVTTERPTLAVVRKYENDREHKGASASLVVNDALRFRGTYGNLIQRLTRLYDFDEDLDIFSFISPQLAPSNQSEYSVVFSNALTDTATVLLDGTILIQALEPGGQQLRNIPAGIHTFDISAPGFNSFATTQDIQTNLTWSIRYNPPSTPNDRDVKSNNLMLTGIYEPNKRLRNELRLTTDAQDDAVLGTKSGSTLLSNSVLYTLGDRTTAQAVTSYSRLSSETVGASKDTQSGLNHFWSLGFEKSPQTSMSVSHTLSSLQNRGLNSLVNNVEASMHRNFTRRFESELKVTGGQQTNNRNFTGRNLSVKTNQKYRDVDVKFAKATFTDEFEVKLNSEKNPDQYRNEYINRFRIVNEVGRVGIVGQLTIAADYVSRWKAEATGSIYEGRYVASLTISNHEWRPLSLLMFLTREQSQVSGSGAEAGNKYASTTARFSGRLQLSSKSDLSGSVMAIDQLEVDIQRTQLNFSWVWPIIPLRHTIGYQNETKAYRAMDTEVYRSFTQSVSLRWRQILLAIKHEISFEDVRLGSSRYQGVRVSLDRGFNL